ncbi:MAG: DUF3043 domain-containing protein [Cryobacterium sp.]|uniref:DUF3043 domain-containing protein n=1 Tax=unclassified Cryobacterium TaxID=2649013 RepID=UPI0018C91767|nr:MULTISPECIES: DUF3043 domain-containing protein [unclassified Cryobacterium]MCY7404388.1 DUF3043 domain-containing protein [Cryobacterium sp.]MEC5154681.1 hypothetical protein [Cryobacterium sp. CAN_C3]
MAKPPVHPDAQPSIESSDETAARLGLTPNAGKGQATPTRKQQEAANKRPLVPDDRKLAAKQARAKSSAARDVARVGMAAGVDKYLPLRERGPQKRYARDYVDARFNVGELMIPIMFLVILLTTIPSVDVYAIFALWAFFILAVIDCVVLGFILTKKIEAKFGADKAERVRWYAAMRALQLRPMRLPKPQVKRRQYPI